MAFMKTNRGDGFGCGMSLGQVVYDLPQHQEANSLSPKLKAVNYIFQCELFK